MMLQPENESGAYDAAAPENESGAKYGKDMTKWKRPVVCYE